TMLFRFYGGLIDLVNFSPDFYSGDRLIAYYCALFGNLYRMPLLAAAYRETKSGVWSGFTEMEKIRQREMLLDVFHRRIGFDVENPVFAVNGVRRISEVMMYGIRNPTFITNRKFYSTIYFIWRKYRFMNRCRLAI